MASDRDFGSTRGIQNATRGAFTSGNAQPEDEMLTAQELARLLKISVKTIYRYVQEGLIPYVRIQSNVRFPKRKILEWIERQSYQPWPPSATEVRRP